MTEEEDEEMIELLKRKIPVFELKFKAFLKEKGLLKRDKGNGSDRG